MYKRFTSYLPIFPDIMENLITEVKTYTKKISKKKATIDRLLAHIKNTAANNREKQSLDVNRCLLNDKDLIREACKISHGRKCNRPGNYDIEK